MGVSIISGEITFLGVSEEHSSQCVRNIVVVMPASSQGKQIIKGAARGVKSKSMELVEVVVIIRGDWR